MTTATLKSLALEAIAVQNACNLSGVVHSFARAMSALCELVPSGTDARNTHPIAILWADKVAHLTGTQDIGNSVVMGAYAAVYALADGP